VKDVREVMLREGHFFPEARVKDLGTDYVIPLHGVKGIQPLKRLAPVTLRISEVISKPRFI